MAKKVYVGVSSTARKVKRMYVGVSSKARRVKKGYVGINGVARLFYASEGLDYYGTARALSKSRNSLAATTIGNYALFGGGAKTSEVNTVVVYVNEG